MQNDFHGVPMSLISGNFWTVSRILRYSETV